MARKGGASMNVTTRVEISMGHRLLGYDGKCAYLHGHNYIVEVSVAGKPNHLGIVVDFKDLRAALKEILEPFDHSMVLHVDDPVAEVLKQERLVLLSQNPTAENFASLIWNKLIDRQFSPVLVTVHETRDGWATAVAPDRSVRIQAVQ